MVEQIFTDNDDLGHLARQISTHGQEKKYEHVRLGVNSRLDTLQFCNINFGK